MARTRPKPSAPCYTPKFTGDATPVEWYEKVTHIVRYAIGRCRDDPRWIQLTCSFIHKILGFGPTPVKELAAAAATKEVSTAEFLRCFGTRGDASALSKFLKRDTLTDVEKEWVHMAAATHGGVMIPDQNVKGYQIAIFIAITTALETTHEVVPPELVVGMFNATCDVLKWETKHEHRIVLHALYKGFLDSVMAGKADTDEGFADLMNNVSAAITASERVVGMCDNVALHSFLPRTIDRGVPDHLATLSHRLRYASELLKDSADVVATADVLYGHARQTFSRLFGTHDMSYVLLIRLATRVWDRLPVKNGYATHIVAALKAASDELTQLELPSGGGLHFPSDIMSEWNETVNTELAGLRVLLGEQGRKRVKLAH